MKDLKNGFIHVYEGDGKGKTTAAVGLSIRFAGSGGNVIFAQFMKNNTSSELSIMADIKEIEVVVCKESFGFYWEMTKEEKELAKECYRGLLDEVIGMAQTKMYQMLVLDEILDVCNLGLVEPEVFLNFLKNKPKELEVILTGRNASKEILELADYISHICKIKHPFDIGVGARKGIEL